MTRQLGSVTLTVAIATFAALIKPPTVHAATSLPNPPQNVCIEDSRGCVPPVTRPSGGIKWHPGHYGTLQGVGWSGGTGYSASQITSLAAEPNVIGVYQRIYWQVIEPTRGNYDFSRIDALLALAQENGKRVILTIADRSYAGGDASYVLPAYLATEPGGEGGWYIEASGSVHARIWLPAIMDRYIAMLQAVAAHVDTHPYLEAIYNEETSPGIPVGDPSPASFTRQAAATQWKRWMSAMPSAFAHTNVFLQLNYLSGEVEGLVATAAANRVGIAGPDTRPGNPTRGQRVHIGQHEDGTAGGIDYRGRIPAGFQVQGPELGGKDGDYTPQQLLDEANNVYHTTHMPWVMRPSNATKTDWPNEILPFIRAGHPLTHSACPRQYTSCNTN